MKYIILCFSEVNWASQEPNGGTGENCAALYYSPNYKVVDMSCSIQQAPWYYKCEQRAGELHTLFI